MFRSSLLLAAYASSSFAAPIRKVLVTGANKGIGLHICRRILRDHPDCHVLLGSRSLERGEAAVKQLLKEDPGNNGRVEALELDVTSDESVRKASERLRSKEDKLYGIVNNAGIGFGYPLVDTLDTNLFGVKRVCESFLPLIDPETGRRVSQNLHPFGCQNASLNRIVNIASASGPNFVNGIRDEDEKTAFTSAGTTWTELETIIKRYTSSGVSANAYGLSKACVNLYTRQLAKAHPHLRINSCSPGYILTDLTAGMGASTPPEKSNCHVAPLFLLFGNPEGNGRYYGSDAVRSPLDVYRGPGDPPYVADD